jgi:hypothetical protein
MVFLTHSGADNAGKNPHLNFPLLNNACTFPPLNITFTSPFEKGGPRGIYIKKCYSAFSTQALQKHNVFTLLLAIDF